MRPTALLLFLLAPSALRAGDTSPWPPVERQLARVPAGSALEALVRANQDVSLLAPDEADDALGHPPWLRILWRKAHPPRFAAGDPTKGYPLVLHEMGEWMLAHPDLKPPAFPAGTPHAAPLQAVVGANTSVSGTQSAPRSESDVRVAPFDPSRVLCSSNDIESSGRLGQYASSDGGATWSRTALPLAPGDAFQSDPAVEWTSDGAGWSAAIGISGSTLRLWLYRSTDAGATWSLESGFSGSQAQADKELIRADRSSISPWRDRIHAVWHDGPVVYANRRTAGSAGTWLAAPLAVSGAETAGTGIGADVTTNSAGVAFALWPDTGAGSPRLFAARSTNGGDSWGAPVPVAPTHGSFTIGVPAMANRRALIYVSAAAYRAGARDEVYASWTDLSGAPGCTAPGDEPGANAASSCTSRVFFARSTDGGATWSAPARTNEDGGKHDQFNQRLALDDISGELALVYADTVGDPGRRRTDLFVQSSWDGGLTWTCPVKVTTASTDETVSGADLGNQYGDYNGLSGGAGVWLPTWTDRRAAGREQIFTASVATSPGPGAPATGSISVPGANAITVTWGASSPPPATYNVWRATGTCAAPGPFVNIATASGSPYTDTLVSGGVTYAYEIGAPDANGCEAAPRTACLSATATGVCRLPPGFAGLASVTSPGNADCTLRLAWTAATPGCTGPVAYDVFRSLVSGFAPSPANRVAAGVPGTTWDDTAGLADGVRYYYVVRAVDLGDGASDFNTVELSGVPVGPFAPRAFLDTFEGSRSGGGFDEEGWTHAALLDIVDWVSSTDRSKSPTHSWFSPSLNRTSDRALESPVFVPTATSVLSFWHSYEFEGPASLCFDGGALDWSTDGGSTWKPVPGGVFTAGGYNGTIASGWDNPLSGRPAWCGGTLGPMTEVKMKLAGWGGKAIRIRWREGDDRDGWGTGWYVDSVSVTNASFRTSCAAGSAPARLYTLAPCRVVDTRGAAGPLGGPTLAAGAERVFALAGACGVPPDAAAVVVNATAVNAAADGDLRLFPAGITAPGTSTVSFRAGQVRASAAVVKLSPDGSAGLAVKNGAAGPVDIVLDVSGFFR